MLLALPWPNQYARRVYIFIGTTEDGNLVWRLPQCAQNRQDLISNPKSRCKHEQFGEKDKTNIQR